MKNILIVIAVLVLIGLGVYFFAKPGLEGTNLENNEELTDNNLPKGTQPDDTQNPNAEGIVKNEPQTTLGQSVGGNAITAYHFGGGDRELLFVGGIHGGYSWNTTLLAYEMIDYLEANPTVLPENIKITVVPVMNPDGLEKATGSTGRFEPSDVSSSNTVQVSGRFNGNNVDLSRNFDCNWQTNALWQNKAVSGGSAVFSEPESVALKNYIETSAPEAVVVWYSAEGKVYASSCGGAVLPETTTIMNAYAKASGYGAGASFNAYKVTGDFVDWLAKVGMPAISVLLTNHQDVEWEKNKAGMEALIKYYAEE